MKLKKRFLVTLLAVALVIAMLAMPASALNSTMTYKNDSGSFIGPDGRPVSYGCTTGASTTKATGSMTLGGARAYLLTASLTANIFAGGANYQNEALEIISGTYVSVSTTNVYDKDPSVVGDITSATATYMINNFLTINQAV